MTKLLEKALEAVRRLPPRSQDEIAQAMLTLAGHEGEPEAIDPAHLPAVLEGLAQARAASSLPMKRSKPRFAASRLPERALSLRLATRTDSADFQIRLSSGEPFGQGIGDDESADVIKGAFAHECRS